MGISILAIIAVAVILLVVAFAGVGVFLMIRSAARDEKSKKH